MSLYSHLSGQTGWFQATMSRGLLVAEADLLLDNCSINSKQSWAEFGDGWMHDIMATGRDAAAPRIAHHAQERPTSDAGMGQRAQWHFCLSWAAGDACQHRRWLPGRAPPQETHCSAVTLPSTASLLCGQQQLPSGTFPECRPGQSSGGCRQLGLSATCL